LEKTKNSDKFFRLVYFFLLCLFDIHKSSINKLKANHEVHRPLWNGEHPTLGKSIVLGTVS